MRSHRTLPLLAAVAAFVLTAPPAASAAESAVPTAQQKAYGLDWAPFIDPADLPPVEQRKVVCLVDSGVAITEDLPSDRPEGPIVQRIAVDGGSGLPGPKLEHQHGTQMASFAGAVMGNDWGTVGAWPGVRILSVRAMRYDATGFAARDWRQGIAECRGFETRMPIAAINLSLGGTQATTNEERELLREYVNSAHDAETSIVAAAGNGGRDRVDVPADVPGVLAVAAGNTQNGDLCSYASYSSGVLVGPGCGVDAASAGLPVFTDGGGSSAATTFVSTTIALLRTLYLKKYQKDASWSDAERWLFQSATVVAGRSVLNAERAAHIAGLDDVVERARRRIPSREPNTDGGSGSGEAPVTPDATTPVLENEAVPSLVTASSGSDNQGPAAARLPKRLPTPRFSVSWRRGVLMVRVKNRPTFGSRVQLVTTSDATRSLRTRRTVDILERSTIRLRQKKRPRTVTLRFVPLAGDVIAASASATMRAQGVGYR